MIFEPHKTAAQMRSTLAPVFIIGETYDLSGSGIAFIVSSIRVKEHYLVGQDRTLVAELDLPGGAVVMRVVGKRYERVGVHLSMEKYLIGAEIVDMTDDDREAYDCFLKHGGVSAKSATAALEMGID
ncbi:MAG: hypothetical protein ACR2IH_00105 [Pyrinomonadaceae bacterium]